MSMSNEADKSMWAQLGRAMSTWGGFHKLKYAQRQALALCALLLSLKTASQKFGAECKMALCPTFSLYEINPWGGFHKEF